MLIKCIHGWEEGYQNMPALILLTYGYTQMFFQERRSFFGERS